MNTFFCLVRRLFLSNTDLFFLHLILIRFAIFSFPFPSILASKKNPNQTNKNPNPPKNLCKLLQYKSMYLSNIFSLTYNSQWQCLCLFQHYPSLHLQAWNQNKYSISRTHLSRSSDPKLYLPMLCHFLMFMFSSVI